MTEERPLLGPIIFDQKDIKREVGKRKKQFDFLSVPKGESEEYLNKGWYFYQELKTKTKLKKSKNIDEKCENKFWYFLFRIGFKELNEGRNFQIQIKRPNSNAIGKQIDVFAKDDETVIVAECKTAKTIKKKSLQKDIEEFGNLKGPISKAIREHYGRDFKPKILWLFVTENIIWRKPDKERAKGQNIKIITERELRYFLQIAEHLGHAAKYQFLAEYFKGRKIPELKDISIPAIRGKLGGKTYYSFVTTPNYLLKIAFINHRSLNDPSGAPTYQRLVKKKRMRSIGNFIQGGGFFPTNLLINFTNNVRFDIIKKDEKSNVIYGNLYLPDKFQSAWVIDGQHRLYGFAHLEEKYRNQNIFVVAFEKLSKDQEANLFVEINHEQVSVEKNLLDDLEGELKWGSKIPSERIGSIGARLVGYLNQDLGGPFYNRVTQQGIPSTRETCLTLPQIKEGIRRSGIIGRQLQRNTFYDPGPITGTDDSDTLDRALCVFTDYFNLIKESDEKRWGDGKSGYLCTNISIQGYILLLNSILKYMELMKSINPKELDPKEIILEITEYLLPILDYIKRTSNDEFEKEFYVKYGSGGPPQYYYKLCRIINLEYSDFQPDGYKEWEMEQSTEMIEVADKKIKEIHAKVNSTIFKTFKEKYGEIGDSYWTKGVIDKDIMSAAYNKSLDDDDDKRLPLENYLDFIQMKKVVEKKQNWPIFEGVFNIPERGEKGLSKNLKWMEHINKIRRIPAHSTEDRQYAFEDFEYINWIYDEFINRLEMAEKEKNDNAR